MRYNKLVWTNWMLLFVMLFNVSCNEDDEGEVYGTIEDYILLNEITDYKTTDSGLIYIIDEPGTGDLPLRGQTVSVHYTGYFLNETKFDTSDGGDPFSFVLGAGQVIAGWDEGIALFKKGGQGTLLIPSNLAYGSRGAGSVIGPNENLKFDISLEEIQ